MNKTIYFCLLLLVSCAVNAEDATVGAEACQKALKAGDHAQAAAYATQALKTAPGDRELYMCLGRAQGGAGEHAAAVMSLQAADRLSKTPLEHVTAMMQLGNQYKSVKAHAEAIATYRQSIPIAHAEKLKRYEMIALNLIGEAEQEKGDFVAAIEAYQQGFKLAANDNERADSHAHLAAAHRAAGQYDLAIGQQLQAAVLEERSGDLDHYAYASLELGRIYLESRQFAGAEKVMKNLLAVVTRSADEYWEASIYQMQGRVALAQGRVEEGRTLLRRGADLARKIGAEELARDIEATGSM